jgi:hypothetical protein
MSMANVSDAPPNGPSRRHPQRARGQPTATTKTSTYRQTAIVPSGGGPGRGHGDSARDPRILERHTGQIGREGFFRFDTFGDESFWTDTLRMHEAITQAVDPTTALSVGLKLDADALPPGILKTADLKGAATTIALAQAERGGGTQGPGGIQGRKDTLTRVGVTCALCHSTVDDSVMPGIGRRLDGRPNCSLNVGAIIALSRRSMQPRRRSTAPGARASTTRGSTRTGRVCRWSSRPPSA